MKRLAIIGGTGAELYQRAGTEWPAAGGAILDARWGEPSAPGQCWLDEASQVEVLFLPRHGARGSIPPHRVNYRANMALVRAWAPDAVVALNAVGSIAALPAGTLAVPDQLVDYTWGRAHSYFDSADVEPQYIDFTDPYDLNLRKDLINAARFVGLDCAESGTYAVTQGPRLETAAEIDRLERDGCTLVGMTSMPEAALARELGLPYACLALIVNRAAGRGGRDIHADIAASISAAVGAAEQVIEALLKRL